MTKIAKAQDGTLIFTANPVISGPQVHFNIPKKFWSKGDLAKEYVITANPLE